MRDEVFSLKCSRCSKNGLDADYLAFQGREDGVYQCRVNSEGTLLDENWERVVDEPCGEFLVVDCGWCGKRLNDKKLSLRGKKLLLDVPPVYNPALIRQTKT